MKQHDIKLLDVFDIWLERLVADLRTVQEEQSTCIQRSEYFK